MSRKRVSTTVYLEAEQLAELQRLSELTSVPMAVIVREGVELGIARWREVAEVRALPSESRIEVAAPVEQRRLGVGGR